MRIDLPLSEPEIREICVRLEALATMEEEVMPDLGGNESDDPGPSVLQEHEGDLREEEMKQEIHGLDEEQKLALVALMWIGRGDYSVDEWDEAIALAAERHSGPTADYLLSHPLAAEEILDGLDAVDAAAEEDSGEDGEEEES